MASTKKDIAKSIKTLIVALQSLKNQRITLTMRNDTTVTDMFNQRPSSLLGLEPRHDSSSELMNFLSPMLASPDEYIRYLDYLFKAEKLQQESLAASATTPGDQNSISNQFHLQQPQSQPSHQLQQPQLQQLQPQLQPLQLQQLHPPQHHISYPAFSSIQHPEHQYQQLQPPTKPASEPITDPNQNVDKPEVKVEPSANLDVTVSDSNRSQLSVSVSSDQSQVVPQRPSTLDVKPSKAAADKEKTKLTEEERIRNKRERNRKAAADCRRRKDEKLKRLEDENMELRRQIDNLQAIINKLRRGTNSINT